MVDFPLLWMTWWILLLKNDYMLVGKYVFVIYLSHSVIRNFKGTCSFIEMLKGCFMARVSLGTPVIGQLELIQPTNIGSHYAVPISGECPRFPCKLVKRYSWPHHSQKWQKKVESSVVWRLLYERFHGNNPKNKMQDLYNRKNNFFLMNRN